MPAFTVHRGPCAVEEALFSRLDALAAEAEGSPTLLARPVRVVLASGAQTAHFAAAWMRHRGRAAAGVRFDTLFSLAREVLEAADEPWAGGGLAFEILARRAAASQPRLAAGLGELVDGFGAVVASVRDLADAGFTEAHLPALEERLEALPARGFGGRQQVERARELAQVAARCRREMEALGLASTGDLYSRAAERLMEETDRLAARAVLIAGFANATGLALDLLETLVRRCGAEVLLDLPADLAEPMDVSGQAASAGLRFVSRLALRLGGLGEAGVERAVATRPAEAAALRWVSAPGITAEVRAACVAVRALLARGVAPERIALVARDLGPFRLALRADLTALGIPFSGRGPGGSPGATERRLAALLEVLRQGPRLAAERWLAAGLLLPGEGDRLDLRLGLASLGVARLAQVARLDPDLALVGGELPLPVPAGEADPEEASEEAEPRPRRRRRLAGRHLIAAVWAAGELLRHLEARPSRAPLAEHLAWLSKLTGQLLAWPASDPAAARLAAVVARLRQELPVRLTLTPDELALALERGLGEVAELPLGGEGGGVAVLSATEARSLTFEHLFLLGGNRDLFPRKAIEDPLLPDPLRRALLDVLPDLPVKGEGHDEERHLFAQLLASAPQVTLSFSTSSDDGEPRSISPLLERLRLAGRVATVEQAPHVYDPLAAAAVPLPAGEEALLRGLVAGRRGMASALPAALASAGQEPGLAPLKVRLLDELDPDLSTPEGRAAGRRLGPGFGLVGPQGGAASDLYVTELEDLAACSWRRTLERGMGLEPTPDPLSTFAALDGAMVGEVVHAVVARWVEESGGASEVPLAQALEQPAVALTWPVPRTLAGWIEAASRRVARERGVPLLAQALAARARVLLAVVERELTAALEATGSAAGIAAVVGAELVGETALAAAPGGRVLFRADLVEMSAAGLLLTDLKAGRPFSELKKPENRQARLLEAVARGERLQAAAYALTTSASPSALADPSALARGRYLYAGKPEAEVPARLFELTGDEATRRAFEQAAQPLLAARAGGAFLPRLLDARLEREGPACRTCQVLAACPQRDSGAPRRLARWVESRRQGGPPSRPAAELALAVFELGRAEGGEGAGS